jgi:uncharacterized membrane protein
VVVLAIVVVTSAKVVSAAEACPQPARPAVRINAKNARDNFFIFALLMRVIFYIIVIIITKIKLVPPAEGGGNKIFLPHWRRNGSL